MDDCTEKVMHRMSIAIACLTLGCAEGVDQEVLTTKRVLDSGVPADTYTAPPDTAASACESGTCKPGETRESACGNCGKVVDVCDPTTCTWNPGTCMNEGPCEPGTSDEAACVTTGEFRKRTCSTTCTWGEYGACGVTKPWTTIAPAPIDFEARYYHSAVWTGAEMIVWGGKSASVKKDGAAYDPAKDTWRTLAAPPTSFSKGRFRHSAAWTGSKMIVWGGIDGDNNYGATGAAYDPRTDAWSDIKASPLSARSDADALWTGSELILWGGTTAEGASYDPATDTWTMLPTFPLSARAGARGVWNGSVLIVWSGCPGGVICTNDGATYDPKTRAWTKMADPPSIMDGRFEYVALNNGAPAFFWGGYGGTDISSLYKKTGALWNPTSGWKPMAAGPTSMFGSYGGRQSPLAWVAAGKLYVFSGLNGDGPSAAPGGGIYEPASDTWTSLPSADAPLARVYGAAVFTGAEAIVWGGAGTPGVPTTYLRDGARFRP